jgi:hypothetical protein
MVATKAKCCPRPAVPTSASDPHVRPCRVPAPMRRQNHSSGHRLSCRLLEIDLNCKSTPISQADRMRHPPCMTDFCCRSSRRRGGGLCGGRVAANEARKCWRALLMSYPPPSEMSPLVAEIRFDKGSMRRQALPSWDGGRFSSLSGRRQRCFEAATVFRGFGHVQAAWQTFDRSLENHMPKIASIRCINLLLQLRYRSTSTRHAIQPQPLCSSPNTTQSASSHRTIMLDHRLNRAPIGLRDPPRSRYRCDARTAAVHLTSSPRRRIVPPSRLRVPESPAPRRASSPRFQHVRLCLIGFRGSRDSGALPKHARLCPA